MYNYKKKINERFGINNDVIILSDFIYNIIIEQILIFSKDLENKEIYNKTILKLENDEIVNSAAYTFPIKEMNNRLDKLSLDKLKLKDFIFELDITFINENMFDLELYNASFNDLNLKLKDNIFYNGKLFFDLYIPSSYLNISIKNKNTLKIFLNNFKINKEIISMLNHEFTHALEFTQKFKKGKNISEERLLNFLIYLLKKDEINKIAPLWSYFLNLIYLHLSHEVNARVSQLYSLISNKSFNTQIDFWNEVKQTSVWKEMINLYTFNSQIYYNNFYYNANDKDINDLFNYSGTTKDKVLKHLIHMFDDKINIVNDYFEQFSDVNLKKLSKHILNEPIIFLNFWEKRFKNIFEKFKKKVGKLYIIENIEINERKKEKRKNIWWIIKKSKTPLKDLNEYIKNNDNVNIRNKQKITPLMYCIKYFYKNSINYELAKILIPVSNLNLQDIYGQTALFITLQKKELDLFTLIINTDKINLNATVNGDDNYLDYAIRHNSYRYIWLILDHLKKIKFEDIYKLLEYQKNAVVKFAIDKTDIKELIKINDNNETLFHVCTDKDIFIILIEKGVDMTKISNDGYNFLINMNESDIKYIISKLKEKNNKKYKYIDKIIKKKTFNL